ncbi:aspartate--tRNA ligase [Holospora obtusa F1]|uniref:Aspartate--tRNA(Asp/Asn) ligase n=1 Tax=Holospora obtusa F1 TaxID=1399147 RepID=W6TF65_HOLOB|nr:aspartate--tRNA ligase [Holospora obtusa]ETZ07616.1 aspartate--tRNA ligase [Holospora obtusa F1]
MNSFYRTESCGALRANHERKNVKLSGWIHRKRDHGQLLFVDLRDHYGITQCVVDPASPAFVILEHAPLESVVSVEGEVVLRQAHLVNTKIETGEIEVKAQLAVMLSQAAPLPLTVNSDEPFPEETRLKYRFLDLRRPKLHQHIVLRGKVIQFLREQMQSRGFLEIQTPILTGTSPEGARDYVVPSRLYPGQFYALPQAPQQFKQLLMASGFDKYFQISPCFRDEDPRADRSPGEFYQLDMEMSFVTQEEIFSILEPVLRETFLKFAPDEWQVSLENFPRIPYEKALEEYGSDKPDLRNPLKISNLCKLFHNSSFPPFQGALKKKGTIRALKVPGLAQQSRQFLKMLESWALEQGAPGLGYILRKSDKWQGPLVKFFSDDEQLELTREFSDIEGVGVCFMAGPCKEVEQFLGKLRTYVWKALNPEEEKVFKFCWIVDFPMYEEDPLTQSVVFSHNPFSMPQGGMKALEKISPLEIKAFQYDIVCNGVELCSGAIRNHDPEIMKKAFLIAGYADQEVERQFGALLNAFRYGVPPHGGAAPGIERILMLLCQVPNIREVVAFPWTQQGKDLLMQAPGPLPSARLKELHLRPLSS